MALPFSYDPAAQAYQPRTTDQDAVIAEFLRRQRMGGNSGFSGTPTATPVATVPEDPNPAIARQVQQAEGYVDKTAPPPTIAPVIPPPAANRTAPDQISAVPVDAQPTPAPATVEDVGTPPVMIVRDKKGRPQRAVGGADLAERNAELRKATEEYVPQAEPKWKHWLRLAGLGGSMIGGAIGHDTDTVARATLGLGRQAANRKASDEDWRKGRLAELDAETDKQLGRDRQIAQTEAIRATATGKVDAATAKALDGFNKLENYDPNDPKYAGLKAYFEKYGLVGLPERNRYHQPTVSIIGGRAIISDAAGQRALKVDGEAVVDKGKMPTESVKIGDTTYENLTPQEAAILGGRAYEGQATRESRETEGAAYRASRENIVGKQQAGANSRAQISAAGSGKSGGVLNPSLRAAIISISKFRALTSRIATAQARGDDYGQAQAEALMTERDGLEQTIRSVYGDMISNDEKGKPTVLNEAYTKPPSTSAGNGNAGLTIEGAIQHFKTKHKRAPTTAEVSKMQSAIDSMP